MIDTHFLIQEIHNNHLLCSLDIIVFWNFIFFSYSFVANLSLRNLSHRAELLEMAKIAGLLLSLKCLD